MNAVVHPAGHRPGLNLAWMKLTGTRLEVSYDSKVYVTKPGGKQLTRSAEKSVFARPPYFERTPIVVSPAVGIVVW